MLKKGNVRKILITTALGSFYSYEVQQQLRKRIFSFYYSKAIKVHAIRAAALTFCSVATLHRSPEQQSSLHFPLPLQKELRSVLHSSSVKQPLAYSSTDAPLTFTSAYTL